MDNIGPLARYRWPDRPHFAILSPKTKIQEGGSFYKFTEMSGQGLGAIDGKPSSLPSLPYTTATVRVHAGRDSAPESKTTFSTLISVTKAPLNKLTDEMMNTTMDKDSHIAELWLTGMNGALRSYVHDCGG